MGANTFYVQGRGETAHRAFNALVDQALYDHGHAGYTGTIAEKDDFEMIKVPVGWDGTAESYASKLIQDDDPRVCNKWGPAGCIQTGPGEFLFFGWASS